MGSKIDPNPINNIENLNIKDPSNSSFIDKTYKDPKIETPKYLEIPMMVSHSILKTPIMSQKIYQVQYETDNEDESCFQYHHVLDTPEIETVMQKSLFSALDIR